jgi:hypothetical protein
MKPGDVVHVIGHWRTMVVIKMGDHLTQCSWMEDNKRCTAVFKTKTLMLAID